MELHLESKRLSLDDLSGEVHNGRSTRIPSSQESLNELFDLSSKFTGSDDQTMDVFCSSSSNTFSNVFPNFSGVDDSPTMKNPSHNFLNKDVTDSKFNSGESHAKASPARRVIQNPLLSSPLSAINEDLEFDSLRKHMKALNLNVDNHLSKLPCRNRPEFSFSGKTSMTPNPRIDFHSPQSQKVRKGLKHRENFEDSDGFGMPDGPEVKAQLNFDNDFAAEEHVNGNTQEKYGSKHDFKRDTKVPNGFESFDMPLNRQMSYDWLPSVQPFDSINQSSSHLQEENSQYGNLQAMQQVILPNGMPAMVIPMVDVSHSGVNDSSFGFNKNSKISLHRSVSFNSYKQGRGKGIRKNMISPMHLSQAHSKSFHAERSSSFQHPSSQLVPPETPLSTFVGRIFMMAQEQNGCRYLQQKIELEKEHACAVIFNEVRPKLTELMMDPFGNYLFQKLIETVSNNVRYEMLQRVQAELVYASLNLHGTRSVQKFIEVCGGNTDHRGNSQHLDILVDCLSPYVTKLSMDTNGNHVIQRCLQHLPKKYAKFVYDAALKDVMIITKHRHGCCVFQRCIDAADDDQRRLLVGQVVQNAVQLMQDPFGNYVVQYVLDNCKKEESDVLISQSLGMLSKLSMQKFSSNVIEKCLLAAPLHIRASMIQELSNSKHMRDLLHDQYANYVVQRALLVADEEQGMTLVKTVAPHIADLGKFNPSCAKRVAGRIMKKFPNLARNEYYSKMLTVHLAASGRVSPEHRGNGQQNYQAY